MREVTRVAVLMTTHSGGFPLDRSLQALRVSTELADVVTNVYLANSGTSQSGILSRFRSERMTINEIRVSSNSFWANSMRLASETSIRDIFGSDYTLWLNDDTFLEPQAIHTLIDVSKSLSDLAIIVGSTRSNASVFTYGGKKRRNGLFRLHFQNVLPDQTQLTKCETFNGNCVLIPTSINQSLGGFPKGYSHLRADLAFGLKADKKKIRKYVAPGYLAECEANSTYPRYVDLKNSSVASRLKFLSSPKVGPFRDHIRFSLTFGGVLGPLYALAPLIRSLFAK
jgi:GT2 family glycosyltransferase